MLSVTLTSIGFVGLALACWPSSRLRVLSLHGAVISVRLSLLVIIGLAFTATIWPGWNDAYAGTDELAKTIGTLAAAITTLPLSVKTLAVCTAIVVVTLPVLSMIDLARQATMAVNLLARETTARPHINEEKPAPPPVAPAGRRELQIALDAMTRAATNGTASPSVKKRTLAEIVK